MTTAFKPTAMPDGAQQAPIREAGRKKPGRPKGSPPMGGRRPTTRSLEPQIAATLMAFNLALYVVPPLQRDMMDEAEITALARAIDAQCKQQPRFRKMVEGALSVTSGGQLLGVLVIMGARRASRHGILPPDADGVFGSMLAASVNTPRPPEAPDVPAEPAPIRG